MDFLSEAILGFYVYLFFFDGGGATLKQKALSMFNGLHGDEFADWLQKRAYIFTSSGSYWQRDFKISGIWGDDSEGTIDVFFKQSMHAAIGSEQYRISAYSDEELISLWHDIPLVVNYDKGLVNYICEIPIGVKKIFEMNLEEQGAPIWQAREYGDLLEYKRADSLFNHGALPRTWLDPRVKYDVGRKKNYAGNNAPIDVIEIGRRLGRIGEVRQIKVLGSFMMIEEGEFADWKVIAIDAADDDAELLNGIEDVEGKWPGLLDYLRTWWRFYHKGANKDDRAKKNKFGFHENFFGRDFTIANVVDRGNQAWFEQYSPERKKHKFISHVNISDVETDVEVTLTDEYDESRYSDMELDDGIVGMRGDQIVDIVDADKIRSRDRQSYASTNLDAASQGITVGKLDIGGLVNQTHKVQAFLDGVDDDRVREAFNSSAYQQYKQNVFSGGLRPAVHDQNDIDEFLARV